MRILEALKILEDATIECKTREIDTPEVREALDALAPYCRPEWRVTGFRDHLAREEEFGPGGEGQQQNLRVCFAGASVLLIALTVQLLLDKDRPIANIAGLILAQGTEEMVISPSE